MTDRIARLRDLHESGTFVILNAWDAGSARFLVAVGATALATTSSGFAASLGRKDQHVSRDELVAHVAALTAAVDVPVSVDAEYGFADDDAGLRETVRSLSDAGAAGFSLEDFDPAAGAVIAADVATHRIAVAAEAAAESGGGSAPMVLTARAENHLYGVGDLDDTIARLRAYRAAGADVVFAPGLVAVADIRRVVDEVGAPVNVLIFPGGPSVPDLASIGVRRISVGGALAFAAYGAAVDIARELLGTGAFGPAAHPVDRTLRDLALSAAEVER